MIPDEFEACHVTRPLRAFVMRWGRGDVDDGADAPQALVQEVSVISGVHAVAHHEGAAGDETRAVCTLRAGDYHRFVRHILPVGAEELHEQLGETLPDPCGVLEGAILVEVQELVALHRVAFDVAGERTRHREVLRLIGGAASAGAAAAIHQQGAFALGHPLERRGVRGGRGALRRPNAEGHLCGRSVQQGDPLPDAALGRRHVVLRVPRDANIAVRDVAVRVYLEGQLLDQIEGRARLHVVLILDLYNKQDQQTCTIENSKNTVLYCTVKSCACKGRTVLYTVLYCIRFSWIAGKNKLISKPASWRTTSKNEICKYCTVL